MKKFLIVAGVVFCAGTLAAAVLFAWAWNNPLTLQEWGARRVLDASLTRSTVATAVGELTYWEGGAGGEVVFLHGAGDQAGAWTSVVPALAGDFRLVLLDLPGHGDSAPPEGPLRMSTIVEGAAELLESRDNGMPVTLVGNSLGAWVAMLLAERLPERIDRVVLVNGGPLRHVAGGPTLMPADREEARKLVEAIRDASAAPAGNNVLDDIIERTNHGPIARLFAEQTDMEDHLMDGRLGGFETPVDILWGESDRLMPPDYARRMDSELPRSRLTFIPRCGHLPASECPESFSRQLSEILQLDPPDFRTDEAGKKP